MTTSHHTLPPCWDKLNKALNAGIDRIVLFGPSGTGKTYGGLNYGHTRGGAHRLICTEDMTTANVEGNFMPNRDGSWSWVAGSALKAWEGDGLTGGRLVVDEIDKAGGDVFATLLSFLDSPESASWEHPETGRIHRPREGFSVVMTTNVENMNELPTALVDRFPVRIRIDQPHPDALDRLSQDLRGLAVRLADAGRERVSLRAFYAFDQLRNALPLDEAAEIVFGPRASSMLEAIKIDSLETV
jgi:MoxR-like ATPase